MNWFEARLRAWRWGTPVGSWCLAFVVAATLIASSSSLGSAAEAEVRFDVPALIPAKVVAVENEMDETGNPAGLKLIRVVIPVTTEISTADRSLLNEFRYDIQWRRDRFPLVDYGPQTQTTSTYDGTIEVEKETDRNATLGVTLGGGGQQLLLSGKTEAVDRRAEKRRYHEVPQQQVLVASGTMDRGTGAFFRFHASRQQTLEGNRNLMATFRVPLDWRGGLLKVKCVAMGSRKVLGIWDEPVKAHRMFTLPVYIEGDEEAREAAIRNVRTQGVVAAQKMDPTYAQIAWRKLQRPVTILSGKE